MNVIECPECGRLLEPCSGHHRRQFPTHAIYPTGPECVMSRQAIEERHRQYSEHTQRAQRVMVLAHRLRTEDPAHVWRQLERTDPDELRRMLATALAGIPTHLPATKIFGWVYDLAPQGIAS